jgi:hypothetical protein
MFKDLSPDADVKVNVSLKNGAEYLGRDMPSQPFGIDGAVSFWNEAGTKLLIVPLQDINLLAMYDANHENNE